MKDAINLVEMYKVIPAPQNQEPVYESYLLLNAAIAKLMYEFFINLEDADCYEFINAYLRWVRYNNFKLEEMPPIIEGINNSYNPTTKPLARIHDMIQLYCASEEGQFNSISLMGKCAIIFNILQNCGLKFVFN